MPLAKMALLTDRGVVRVAGPDAEKFLDGIVTADLETPSRQAAVHSALLTPQGKILFEFFVIDAPGRDGKRDGGFLLETGREQVDGLVKRLRMYMLRAKVTAEDVSGAFEVAAAWRGPPSAGDNAIVYDDPRGVIDMGARMLTPVPPGFGARPGLVDGEAEWVPEKDYHAHRIARGVPEGGKDYALGDTFPHEADLDLLNGVSFTKGCFIGQEVVARMKHKGVVRKRVVPVKGAAPLRAGAPVKVGEAEIGRIGSVAGTLGLALLRLDRYVEARAKGEALHADDIEIWVRPSGLALVSPATAAGSA
jgi:folate-binding protein YgfZ